MILLPLFAWILALSSVKLVESAASSVSTSSSKTTTALKVATSVSTPTTSALIPSAAPLPQQESISISLSVSNSNGSDGPNLTRENIIEIHAILMWIGFLICPSIGVFIARFLKRKLGHNWFRLHATIMTFGSLAAVSGVLVICLYTPSSSSSTFSKHFQSSHAKLGLVILSILGLQIVLGVMSNFLFNVKRSSIPIQDKMHWWMGRLLAILALVQIQAGWSLYQTLGYKLSPLVLVTHYFIVAVIIGCFMTAEFKLGPFYHVSADHKRFSIA